MTSGRVSTAQWSIRKRAPLSSRLRYNEGMHRGFASTTRWRDRSLKSRLVTHDTIPRQPPNSTTESPGTSKRSIRSRSSDSCVSRRKHARKDLVVMSFGMMNSQPLVLKRPPLRSNSSPSVGWTTHRYNLPAPEPSGRRIPGGRYLRAACLN